MQRLRTIRPDQARLGMFIDGFDGSWLDHPFWRRRFRLDDPADLAKLRGSDVAIVIDEARGRALDEPKLLPLHEAEVATAASPEPETQGPAVPARAARRRAEPRSSDPEIARAKALLDHCGRVVRQMFDDTRLGVSIDVAAAADLVGEITASVERSAHALIGICRLKSKDDYTYLHSVAVCALMINLARHLNLPESRTRRLGIAGLLHDVGKMGIPNAILNKPGRLTDEEWQAVRSHPQYGHDLLSRGNDLPEEALDLCLHHHERPDGRGYPSGLGGDAISLTARMGAICDVYDALTSNRAYKAGWTPSQAVTAMAGWTGQFDETLLFRFFRSLGTFPVGRIVRLRTNRLAIVLDNGQRGSRQPVLVFYAIAERQRIAPDRLLLGDTPAHDSVVEDGEAYMATIRDRAAIRAELRRAIKDFAIPE